MSNGRRQLWRLWVLTVSVTQATTQTQQSDIERRIRSVAESTGKKRTDGNGKHPRAPRPRAPNSINVLVTVNVAQADIFVGELMNAVRTSRRPTAGARAAAAAA